MCQDKNLLFLAVPNTPSIRTLDLRMLFTMGDGFPENPMAGKSFEHNSRKPNEVVASSISRLTHRSYVGSAK